MDVVFDEGNLAIATAGGQNVRLARKTGWRSHHVAEDRREAGQGVGRFRTLFVETLTSTSGATSDAEGFSASRKASCRCREIEIPSSKRTPSRAADPGQGRAAAGLARESGTEVRRTALRGPTPRDRQSAGGVTPDELATCRRRAGRATGRRRGRQGPDHEGARALVCSRGRGARKCCAGTGRAGYRCAGRRGARDDHARIDIPWHRQPSPNSPPSSIARQRRCSSS